MNKKSFWLYVVIMTMAVIAVVLAIFILVVTDNKKPSNQHFKEEVSSQVTKVILRMKDEKCSMIMQILTLIHFQMI